jgi:hypothetical protein
MRGVCSKYKGPGRCEDTGDKEAFGTADDGLWLLVAADASVCEGYNCDRVGESVALAPNSGFCLASRLAIKTLSSAV